MDDDGDGDKMDLPRMGWEGMTGQGQVAGFGQHSNKNFRLHKIQGIC